MVDKEEQEEDKITTIQMKSSTRSRIRSLMKKDDTYDEFLNQLCDLKEKENQ